MISLAANDLFKMKLVEAHHHLLVKKDLFQL